MASDIYEFNLGTRIVYGTSSSVRIGEEAHKAKVKRALIVTDKGVRGAGLADEIAGLLHKANIETVIFDDVPEDADVNVMHRIAVALRENKSDGVVVVGGGSPLCAAKGGAVEATNDVSSIRELAGENKFKNPPLPVLCLPTTAGSGSDVSAGAPVYDHENRVHFGVRGDLLYPVVSILDPVLLETCPYKPMIYAGVDALSHAVEGLWGNRATVYTDTYAFESIRLVLNNLRQAVFTHDMESKLNQHLAAAMGIIAGKAGLGLLHGIAVAHYSYKGAHGYRCGVLLPHVMEYNMPAVTDKFARMAVILGERDTGDNRALAMAFVRRVKELLADLEFPRCFENESIQTTPAVVKEVMEKGTTFLNSNIRKVTAADVEKIFNNALKAWEL